MGDTNLNLATLIGSRICHDLISPIGAISNGLELLDLSGSIGGPEMDLIADSVGNAGARIRFFRIAYGGAQDQMLGRSEITSVLKDMCQGTRTRISWGPLDSVPRAQVRLVFLALQCCETAMPYGGDVEVSCVDGSWTITGTADKLNVDTALWSRLSGPVAIDGITPALVQFALLPQIAQEQARIVQSSHASTQIQIRF